MIKIINHNIYVLERWSHVYKELDKYLKISTSTSKEILSKLKNPKLIHERLDHKVYYVEIDDYPFVFKIKRDSWNLGENLLEKIIIVDEMLKYGIPTSEVIYLKDDYNEEESHSLEYYLDIDLSKIRITEDMIDKILKDVKNLHEHKIVHGDLRLENILFKFNENSRDCKFYFIDFETIRKSNSPYAKQYDLLRLYYSFKKHGYKVKKSDFIFMNKKDKYFPYLENISKRYV